MTNQATERSKHVRNASRVPSRTATSVAETAVNRRNALSETILEEARRGGLLDGGKSAHLSFRVPQALVDAAMRETGIDSASELGTLALALLAQPDPVAAVMRRTRGRLGRDHKLDY